MSALTIFIPDELHPDTAALVGGFATALAEKLRAAEVKYGYSNLWADKGWMDECRAQLIGHIHKGDPRDVAAYCAFLWFHNERTELEEQFIYDTLGKWPGLCAGKCAETGAARGVPDNRTRPLTDQSQPWTPEHCKAYPRRASEEIAYWRSRAEVADGVEGQKR